MFQSESVPKNLPTFRNEYGLFFFNHAMFLNLIGIRGGLTTHYFVVNMKLNRPMFHSAAMRNSVSHHWTAASLRKPSNFILTRKLLEK